jgi:hypothetical protein
VSCRCSTNGFWDLWCLFAVDVVAGRIDFVVEVVDVVGGGFDFAMAMAVAEVGC